MYIRRMNTPARIGVGLLEVGLAVSLAACGTESTAASQDDKSTPAGVALAANPTFDAHAGETNKLRKLTDGVHCVGATAVRYGDSGTVHISIELDPPGEAKGVQTKVVLAGFNTVTGFVSGTDATIATDAGGGYGRFNATAYIPIGAKGMFNQTECPSVGIDQQ